ncbi:MAG: cytochrome c55X [Rhodospirillales bacterium]|jgi:mono/diheme cytochrome c family protein|nr:cytochrome c55X [Rhodospirillales bacterium]
MRSGLRIVTTGMLCLIFSGGAGLAADDAASRGAGLYGQFCAQCHGADMEGPVNGAFALRKFPHDDAARFTASVTNGKGDTMPPWGGTLAPDEIASIWAYVQTGGS